MNVSPSIQTKSGESFRALHGFAGATVLAFGVALVLGSGGLPFDRPAVGTHELIPNLMTQLMQIAFALIIIGLAFLATRGRPAVDFQARTPGVTAARREMIALLVYGAVVLGVGNAFGIGLHLHGSVFGPTHHLAPADAVVWAIYNGVFFALIPYLVFRRRGYGHRELGLKSEDARKDILVIAVILLVESIGELVTFPGIFSLSARQLALGVPLTLVLHLLGTGLPVMIFIYSLLFPRYLKVTGSRASAAVLGALTYAGLHLVEYWTVYDSLAHGLLSVAFVFLQFAYPGLIKSVLTLRTGNAWVHLWAYHAIAPHVTVDTPLIVRVFGIS